ncbi:MAG TPA: rhomboid family intramembrane serine protease [Verrucomicrobiales bacterium]|nr:rhomboid family intramembrane serine protease [Verrucomicrobiales bacterium]
MPLRLRLPESFLRALAGAALLVILLWSLKAWDLTIDFFVAGRRSVLTNLLGIHPRSLAGLPGVLFAHFIHRDFAHLAANTPALFVLSFLVLLSGIRRFACITLIVILVSGTVIWLTERATTVGSSTLVFGYLGFVLARGFVEQRIAWIAIAVGLLVVYGLAPSGLLPGRKDVSWIAHGAGLASGILAARSFREPPPRSIP